MPELPEVETLRRDLEPELQGKTFGSIEVRDPCVLTGIGPRGKPRRRVDAEAFGRTLAQKTIRRVLRRGKYLIFELDPPGSLVLHLRMTGQLTLNEPATPPRIAFHFTDGSRLSFSDRRRFGEVFLVPRWEDLDEIRRLGIEPLNGALTAERLRSLFRDRRAPVYSSLMNQGLISGLGNIYVTEALYAARIRPFKRSARISRGECETLADAIRGVLMESIEHRGYSMRTYVDAMGRKGRSQLFSKCYGKAGLPCPRCAAPFRRAVIAGRGVVYCPRCQR